MHNSEVSDGKITMEITKGFTVVFCDNHLEPDLPENKTIDWAKVTRIKILSIEGTNDEK
jgi:hypothetical protein